MKWDDIPAAAKMSATAVLAVMGMVGYLTTYQSDVEAQQYQQYNNSQIAMFRVQTIETQIAQYRYQLLSAQLTAEQRQWINDEINKLNDAIKCIRSGQC